MNTSEKNARLPILKNLIRHKESAIKYLSQCILNRSAKGDPCVDLLEQHNAREKELNALEAEWTLLTGKVEDIVYV